MSSLNLAREALGRHAEAAATAARPAFSFIHASDRVERWTYAEAWARVLAVGGGLLERGLAPGEHVLVRLPHGPDYAFAFFGAVAAGLVPTPVSPQLTDEEVAFLAADAEARGLVAPPERVPPGFEGCLVTPADLAAMYEAGPPSARLPDTQAADAAYLIYTSGTGAQPKGVLHAHRSILGRRPMLEAWEGLRGDDVTLHAGTLNWSYTLGVGLMDPWAAGAHALLHAGDLDAGGWPEVIAAHGVTVFAAVPTVYRQMLKYGRPEALRGETRNGGTLRHGLCAGEALPASVAEEWEARTGLPLYEALGMTEISTYISSGPSTPVRRGSPGRPQPGRRVAILPVEGDPTPLPAGEVGLLAVHRSDPGLMLGYWRRPDEEAAVFRGEWFTGGDLAALDVEGYVWFHGRADDVIKSFGYRLSPLEIEAALEACPGVQEVAVVPHRLDETKTLVAACVVPDGDADAEALRAALEAHAERHLAGYKRPHEYVFVDALPRTANGKVRRRDLQERLPA